ncbi:hypothetical protein SMF913_13902 [Streptomyces malaysiensis]|uniref:Radical SAM core domain-containing protein n=1 Tax=Streptomyces malaysiensis TaxID=92644 RepID=A0A2J7ZC87_STRMQ|nr:hypothetical protein SMF913_13902 [Streptomyces malaysiensis]
MTTVTEAQTMAPRFLWLDLTRKCQLRCTHCYNSSGPDGTHGAMPHDEWISVLDQAARLGVRSVQFIGGEPTMHPHAAALAEHALALGLHLEIFSNLVHITAEWWTLLQRAGASLATSYYSDHAADHNAMTGRPSHARTRENIVKAVRLGIPLRVGVIGDSEEITDAARRDLESLGVTRIGVDHVRPFGRGGQDQDSDASGLCGRCGSGRAAIGPGGEVSPCVFSGWMSVGNVQEDALGAILGGGAMAEANAAIRSAVRTQPELQCEPKRCYPDHSPCYPAQTPCNPQGQVPPACSPDDQECSPGTPSTYCNPRR